MALQEEERSRDAGDPFTPSFLSLKLPRITLTAQNYPLRVRRAQYTKYKQKSPFFHSVRTNFGLFNIGLSASELFPRVPNFRVRTFCRRCPANLPPYYPGSLSKHPVRVD